MKKVLLRTVSAITLVAVLLSTLSISAKPSAIGLLNDRIGNSKSLKDATYHKGSHTDDFKNISGKNNGVVRKLVPASAIAQLGCANGTRTFSVPGKDQFIVPAGVSKITITAVGAAGGDFSDDGGSTVANSGGKGAQVKGTFSVTPGDVLNIFVGQRGQDNIDINAGPVLSAGGGGGGSFVTKLYTDTYPLAAAGGGGGAGSATIGDQSLKNANIPNINGAEINYGNDGIGSTNQFDAWAANGDHGWSGTAGTAGAPSGSGAGWLEDGAPDVSASVFLYGYANNTGGISPTSANALTQPDYSLGGQGGIGGGGSSATGGGGGGGYSGGGGGGFFGDFGSTGYGLNGGGGGSYLGAQATNVDNKPGIGTGDGYVIIEYGEPITSLKTTFCVGETVIFGDNCLDGGTWSSSNPAIAKIDLPSAPVGLTGVVGVSAGTATIKYTYSSGVERYTTVTIIGLPTVAPITGTTSVAVAGTSTLSSITGGGVWSSSNSTVATIDPSTGLVTGVSAGTATIRYTVTNASGCSTTVTTVVTVTSASSPLVPGSIGAPQTICSGSTPNAFTSTTNASGGTGAITYQWQSSTDNSSFTDISGATSATYAPGSLTTTTYYRRGAKTATDAIQYTTPAVQITVNNKPNVTAGSNGPVCAGSSLSLTATANMSSYSWSGPNGFTSTAQSPSVSSSATAAMAGTYSVSVIDANGCTNTSSVIVAVTVVNFSTAVTNVLCFGTSTGTITVTPSGGAAPYTYSKNGGTSYQASNSFTGLAAGTYSIIVKDANNCTATAQSVTITQPTAGLNVGGSGGGVLCFGSATGHYTLNATGGTSPYTYSRDGITFQASNNFTGLSAGSYTFVTKDANGCTANLPVTLTQPAVLALTPTVTPVSCFGGSNGSISIAGNGGSSPYTYSKDGGSTFQSGNVFSSLAAGTYNIVIKDINGCTASQSVTVGQPSVAMSFTSSTVTTCTGQNNGSITLTASNGTAPYQYSKDNGATFQVGNSFSGLAAGNYNILVKDAGGCTSSSTVTIAAYALPNVAISPASVSIVSGNSTTLTASGALTYSWSPSTGLSATNGITVIANPTTTTIYTVTGTDANNCVNTASSTVTVTAPVLVPATALNFDGVNDNITVNNTLGNFGAGDFTIEMSVRTTLSSGVEYLASKRGFCGGDNFWSLQIVNGKLDMEMAQSATIPTNYVALHGNTFISDGVWHHVALTRRSGTVNIYVDGALETSSTATVANINNTYVLEFGSSICNTPNSGNNGSVKFRGDMDEIRIWNRALCTGELDHYRNCELSLPQTGLQAYYKLNAGNINANNAGVTTAVDATGNGNNGTLNNFGLTGTASNWVAGTISGTCSPYIVAIAPITGNASVCVGATTQLSDATSNGTWSSSNSNIASVSASGLVTGNAAGTAVILFTSLCDGVATLTVTVNALPNAPTGSNASACAPSGVTLTATAAGGETVRWFDAATGGNQLAVGNTLNTNVSGTFYAEAVSAAGCASSTRTAITATINPVPIISGGAAAVCINGTTTFNGSGTAAAVNPWVSSNPAIATVSNTGVVTGISSGSVQIMYTTSGGCTATTNVFVSGVPGVGVLPAGSASICAGNSITLNSNSEPGLTYSWTPGGSTTASLTVNSAGTYTLTGTNSYGCSSSASVIVTVNALPNAPTGISASVCAPAGATLGASGSNGETIKWYTTATGGSSISTGNNFYTNTAGTFYAEALNAAGCVSATRTVVTAAINPQPPVLTLNVQNNCNGTTTITANNPIGSVLWNTNATTTSITVSTPGVYWAKQAVNGCESTLSSVNILSIPAAIPAPTVSGSTSFCPGKNSQITASSTVSNANFNWYNASGVLVASGNFLSTNIAQTYYVEAVSNGCASPRTAVTLTMSTPPPTPVVTTTENCDGTTTLLQVAPVANPVWRNVLTPNNIIAANPIVVTGPATYETAQQDALGCISQIVQVVVNANTQTTPVATITANGSTTFCTGGSVTLTASAGGSYLWSNGEITQSITTSVAGSYTVTVSNGVCSATSAATVVAVTSLTTPSFTQVAAICSGASLYALPTTSNNGITGTWTPALNNAATTTYTFTPNAGQCATVTTMTITVNPIPTATIAAVGGTTACPGNTVTLNANTGSGYTYQWLKGGVAISGATGSSYNAPSTGSYTAIITSNGCISAASNAIGITISDVVAPTITCPAAQTVNLDANCSATLPDFRSLLTVSDNCTATNALVITQTPIAGTALSAAGTMTVTFTVTDASNNSSNCTIVVTKKDVTPPTIVCAQPITVNNDLNICGAVVTFAAPTATDNCVGPNGSIVFGYSGALVPWTVPAGVTSIKIKAAGAQGADGNYTNYQRGGKGGYSEGDLTVTPGETLWLAVGGQGTRTNVSPALGGFNGGGNGLNTGNTSWFVAGGGGATDVRRGGNALINRVLVAAGGGGAGGSGSWGNGDGGNGGGSTGIDGHWSGLNGAGMNTPDVIRHGKGGSQSAGGAGGVGSPGSAYNGYPGTLGIGGSASTGSNSLAGGGGGGYYGGGGGGYHGGAGGGGSSYIGGVSNGLTNTGTQSGNGTLSISWSSASATVVQTAGLASGSVFPVGTTVNTFEATDASGNKSTCSFSVTVVDAQAPKINGVAPSNVTVQCNAIPAPATVTAIDNCDPNPTVTFSEVRTSGANAGNYTLTRTWVLADHAGNSSTITQIITVIDNTKPVIVCPQNITVPASIIGNTYGANVTYTATATDNCGTPTITYAPASGSLFTPGTTQVTATADDGNGNTATCTFNVTVIAPEINIQGQGLTILKGDATPQAADDTHFGSTLPGISITKTFTIQNTGNDNLNVSSINISGADAANFTVVGPTAFVVEPGSSVTFNVNFLANTPGFKYATVTVGNDDYDESSYDFAISAEISCTYPVINGAANITASAANGVCGAVVNNTIVINGVPAPDVTYTLSGATIGSGSGTGSGLTFNTGLTIVSVTATNACGTISASYNVTVEDHEFPVIVNLPANISKSTDPGKCGAVITWATVSATDNCTVQSFTSDHQSSETFATGTTTVHYTATDASGNVTTRSFTVTVTDNERPVLTAVPSDVTVECDAVPVQAAVTSNDNCSVASTLAYQFPSNGIRSLLTHKYNFENNFADSKGTANGTTVGTVGFAPGIIGTAASFNGSGSYLNLGTAASISGTVNFAISAWVKTSSSAGQNIIQQRDNGFNGEYILNITSNHNGGVNVPGAVYFMIYNNGFQFEIFSSARVDDGKWHHIVAEREGTAGRIFIDGILRGSGSGPVTALTPSIGTYVGKDVRDGTKSFTGQIDELKIIAGASCDNTYDLERTWSATDANGNQTAAQQIVSVKDTKAPMITLPSNLLLSADNGQCSAAATYTATAVDNCSSNVSISYSIPSGSRFNVGTTTVTVTAKDACGNTATGSFTVTVADNEKPTVICPSNVSVIATTTIDGVNGAYATYGTASTGDNCGVQSTVYSQASGTFFPMGDNLVTVTVTDIHNNVQTCTFHVIVTCVSPLFTQSPADQTINTTTGRCDAPATYTAVASGIPAADLSYTFSGATTGSGSGTGSGSIFNKGVTTVTITASNICGTIATTFNITVEDHEFPVIVNLPANISQTNDPGNCGAMVTWNKVIARDNCPDVTLVSDHNPGEVYPVGTTTVHYTATDASGNVTPGSFTITVTDDEKPVITLPADITHTADAGKCSFTFATGNPIVQSPNSSNTPGSGPSATPSTSAVYLGTASGNDNCGNVVITGVRDDNETLDAPYRVGTTLITWTVTDDHGHSVNGIQTITITDDENPTIIAPAAITVRADNGSCSTAIANIVLGNPTVGDNCAIGMIYNDAADHFNIGTTTVTWTVTDIHGHASYATQTVTVIDDQLPTITCPQPITVSCASAVPAANTALVGASDNCSVTVSFVGDVISDIIAPNKYTITRTYKATDASGNSVTCRQIITVNDNLAPVLVGTLPGGNTGECKASIPAAPAGPSIAALYADNCSGVITATLIKTTTTGSDAAGWTTKYYYAVSDASGNITAACVTYTAKDITAPIVKCPSSISGVVATNVVNGVSGAYVSYTATATDNCGSAVVSYSIAPGSFFPVGTTTVNVTATDLAGNKSYCSFTVTVVCVSPVLTMTSTPTSSIYTGGVSTSLYLGYGAQSTTLSVATTAMGSYSYNWSGTGAAMLSSSTISNPVFTPTKAGSYLFTVVVTNNVTGCSSTGYISICVTDIRVPVLVKDDRDDKQTMCDHESHDSSDCPHKGHKHSCDHKTHSKYNCEHRDTNDKDDDDQKDCDHKSHTSADCPHKGHNHKACDHKTHADKDCDHDKSHSGDDQKVCDHKAHDASACSHNGHHHGTCNHKAHAAKDCSHNGGNADDDNDDNNQYGNSGNYKVFLCHVPPGNPGKTITLSISINAVAAHLMLHPGDRLGSCEQAPCSGYVDNVKPVIECPGNVNVNYGASTTPSATGAAEATDNSGAVDIIFNDVSTRGVNVNLASYYNYTITRTWRATDPNGNYSECVQLITVKDISKPVIICPGNKTVTCSSNAGTANTGMATASDASGAPVTVTSTDVTYGNTITRTWKATDVSGNVSTCTQSISVVDNIAPVITCPGDKVVACGGSTIPFYTGTATATDNCSTVTITYTDVNCANGVITRTWKATDASGNFSTCVQTITKPIGNPCALPYPIVEANNPRSSVIFNESEILRATDPGPSSVCGVTPTQIKLWYNDEHPFTLGVRQVIVKTKTGTTTTNFPVTAYSGTASTVANPLVGTTADNTSDMSGNDVADAGGRPLRPVLYISDITNDPNNRTGDWQHNGTPYNADRISGSWKSAVRVVDKTRTPAVVTVIPDADPLIKNNWNMGSGGDIAPAGLVNEGFGAEIVWNVSSLPLLPGHTYRLQFIVHDGDQNKAGGDAGQACTVIYIPVGTVVTATEAPKQQVTVSESVITKTTEEDLKVTVMPNPSTTFFTLKMESKFQTPIELRVMDGRGRVVDAKSKLGANSTIQIGHNYSSGTYYAELIQGTKRKVVQLIKGRG